MPDIVVGTDTFKSLELALAVRINPELLAAEAVRTPALINELGRVTARAYATKERTELHYRQWRDSNVHRLTNDVHAAEAAGFTCAQPIDPEAKPKQKPPKCPSISAVETYLRTTTEYRDLWERKIRAEEAWAVLHSATDAAQARQSALKQAVALNGHAPILPRTVPQRDPVTASSASALEYDPSAQTLQEPPPAPPLAPQVAPPAPPVIQAPTQGPPAPPAPPAPPIQ